MMRTLLLFLTLLAGLTLTAQTRYSFNVRQNDYSDWPEGFSVVNSTDTALTLHYAIAEIGINEIDNGQAKGHEIVLKGRFGSNAEGMPNLPFENRYIAVPQGAKVVIEIKVNASTTLRDIDLLPAAAEQGNTAVGLPLLRKDPKGFDKDANFPSENAVIAQNTRIRGLDVALLHLTPFRYNPVRKTLEILHDIDIHLRFEGGNGQFGEARYRNRAWDDMLRDLVINSDRLPEAHYEELLNEALRKREEGCEYLIIAPDDDSILAWADILKQFRTKQGIPTKVVTTTECGGNDAETIKAYIQHAYEQWAIPPAAVMLFSGLVDTLTLSSSPEMSKGMGGIPGFPLTFIGYDNGYFLVNYDYYSDNPYADMNGDSIPDLALSRLPALTTSDYQTQVRKLLRYETNPPADPLYYDEPIITSGYEDNKWFLITSQCANGFFRQKTGKHPKNFYMVYNYNDSQVQPDSLWSTGYNTATVVDYFGPSGQNYLSQYPDTLNSWRNMFDNTYFVEALNRSSFLTLYRDHSAVDLWCCPEFESYRIVDLTSKHPTFVLSVGCNTARYRLTKWAQGYTELPLIHTFCNHESGAIGGIGSTTVTHSHFNDLLTWGIIDYIWPSFLPETGSTTPQEFIRPSYALVAGKLFLNQQAFLPPSWWPEKVTTTHNVFHYLGDAYLNLFTEVPQPLHIDTSPYHNDNQWEYSFTVEADATVCLSNEDGIIAVAKATGQPQSLLLPPSSPGDQFLLTATKQNHIRAEQTFTVIAASLPFVYLKEAFIHDHDGNGQLDYGETATIDILLHNTGLHSSEGGQVTLECESPYVEIVQNTAHYTKMGPNTTTLIENSFRIKTATNTPDLTTVVFQVRVDDAANSHTDSFSAVLHAPVLTLIPDISIHQSDGEPSTHILTEGNTCLTFQINNEGHSPSRPIALSMRLKAPFVSLDTAACLHEGLQPDETATVTFTTYADGSVTDPAWLQAQLYLQHNGIEFVKDTLLQYGGLFENFESDTLNPYFTWKNPPSRPWSYSLEDPYEGQRCFVSAADTSHGAYFRAMAFPYLDHKSKVSFRYQTGKDETLKFICKNNDYQYLSAEEWQYAEAYYTGDYPYFTWTYFRNDSQSVQAKVDDICFPPPHRAIAYAGSDFPWCRETPVELHNAYAYDCQSLRWTTNGDGHFEYDSIVNPLYYPGSGDLANGRVTLTLSAFSNDTIVSALQIHFVDDLTGPIAGDSVVNIFQQPVSHYAIDYEPGLTCHWHIEPAVAGVIYTFGHEIDVLWNQQEGITEATLSVSIENSCATEPATKTIRLVGHATPEEHPVDFLLYPNPTEGVVTLVAGEKLTGKATVEVFNLLGERMMLKNLGQIMKDQPIHLDLRHLPQGLYLIRLQTQQGRVTKKVSLVN